MRPLVLCSTAAHRAALLRRLGLPFETARPDFEEVGADHLPAPEMARAYALGKARSLRTRFADADALLLAADQVTEVDGRVLRKATTLDEAAAQLEALNGRTHTLHSTVCIVDAATGREETVDASVRLTMRHLTSLQIRTYVDADQPIGSAGGYLFEGLGVALFESVTGADDSAIVGLPLLGVVALLARFGVDPLAPR